MAAKSTYKKKKIADGERRNLAIRYGVSQGQTKDVTCHYCEKVGQIHWFAGKAWVVFPGLEMDHVIPESKGGSGAAENLVLACRRCNRSKGSKLNA